MPSLLTLIALQTAACHLHNSAQILETQQDPPAQKNAAKLSVSEVNLYENDRVREWFLFTVTYEGNSHGAFTVDISTKDGSALAGIDYQSKQSTLEFMGYNGEKQYFACLIEGDTKAEPNEDFFVVLANVKGPAGLEIVLENGTGTILNNDEGPIVIDEPVRPPTEDEPKGEKSQTKLLKNILIPLLVGAFLLGTTLVALVIFFDFRSKE